MIRINLAPEAKRRRGFGFPGLPAFKLPSFNLGVLFGLTYVIAVVGVTAYWLLLANEGRRLTAQIAAGQQELNPDKVTIGEVNELKIQAAQLGRRAFCCQAIN